MSDAAPRVILGIDLGTTNSAVAVWREEHGRVEVLADEDGEQLVPSVVAWDESAGGWVVGRKAVAVRRSHPERAAYSVKRFIGRRFDHPRVENGRRLVPFRVSPGDPADPLRAVVVELGPLPHQRLTAPDVSARVLAELRRIAARALGLPEDEVRDAVITVPAYFDDHQRKATRLAGELAGLNVLDLLHEPTAAALAYTDGDLTPTQRWLVVADLGGGTFDVAVLKAGRTKTGYLVDTKVVDGDTDLGGDDIDTALARHLGERVERQTGPLDRDHPFTRDVLRREAERAKAALSDADRVTVTLSGLVTADGGRADARLELSRADAEAAAAAVRGRVTAILRRAVEQVARRRWGDVSAVVLVGGQTRMPAVRDDVTAVSGRPILASRPPELAVALGAGEYARILARGEARIHENTLINVLALPCGIRLNRNEFMPLVEANATLPYTTDPYTVTTTQDDQAEVVVDVFQGAPGARTTDDCVHLGQLVLGDLEPAKAGVPVFDVTLEVQADGTVRAAVTDRRTSRRVDGDVLGRTPIAFRDGPPPTP